MGQKCPKRLRLPAGKNTHGPDRARTGLNSDVAKPPADAPVFGEAPGDE